MFLERLSNFIITLSTVHKVLEAPSGSGRHWNENKRQLLNIHLLCTETIILL